MKLTWGTAERVKGLAVLSLMDRYKERREEENFDKIR